MLRVKVLFLSIIFCLIGCSDLPVDSTAAPIDNDHWTLELTTDTTRDLGLIGMTYNEVNVDAKYIEIPLFYKGEYSIRSKRCNFADKALYESKPMAYKRYYIKHLVAMMPPSEFACIFNIMVRTEKMDKAMQGQFVLVKEDGFTPAEATIMGKGHIGTGWLQVRETGNSSIPIWFRTEKAGTSYFEGCGVTKEKKFNGDYYWLLEDLVDGRLGSCVYEFGIEYEDGSKAFFTFNLKAFKKEVLAIPNPVISYSDPELKIKAADIVGYVSIEDKFKKGRKVCKKVGDKAVWVRQITANGRASLYKIQKGEIVWKPSVVY